MLPNGGSHTAVKQCPGHSSNRSVLEQRVRFWIYRWTDRHHFYIARNFNVTKCVWRHQNLRVIFQSEIRSLFQGSSTEVILTTQCRWWEFSPNPSYAVLFIRAQCLNSRRSVVTSRRAAAVLSLPVILGVVGPAVPVPKKRWRQTAPVFPGVVLFLPTGSVWAEWEGAVELEKLALKLVRRDSLARYECEQGVQWAPGRCSPPPTHIAKVDTPDANIFLYLTFYFKPFFSYSIFPFLFHEQQMHCSAAHRQWCYYVHSLNNPTHNTVQFYVLHVRHTWWFPCVTWWMPPDLHSHYDVKIK